MKEARDIQPGDKLQWDATVTSAPAAEVVKVKPVNDKVEITYINPEGKQKTFCYDANEPLWVE